MRRAAALVPAAVLTMVTVPATASAHNLTGRYESPLPLEAYLAGAAIAVGLSFAIVLLRPTGAAPAPGDHGQPTRARRGATQPRVVRVPRAVRLGLRTLGLVAWTWVIVQGLIGQATDGDVASLVLWTYGWVALPIVCAFIGPAWEWLDPFATLHDVLAAIGRRAGLRGWHPVTYPARLDAWPAVGLFVIIVWFELVETVARAGRPLALVLLGYTAWTLLMMAQFGRDAWRRQGETFGVWLSTLGRLAPLVLVEGGAPDALRRRRFGAGLLEPGWGTARLVLVAVATASILFDGLSQTQSWFDLVGAPGLAPATVQLALFLGLVAAAAVLVARVVGVPGMAAGLVPIAFGYLLAHYLTVLAFDGQRLVVVLSDPLGLGWDLFGSAHYEPVESWLPGGAIWAMQLAAVVGGHVVGAVFGHRAAAQSTGPAPGSARDLRLRQVPLAILMVCLTTLTLWSLGQGLVEKQEAGRAAGTSVASRSASTGG